MSEDLLELFIKFMDDPDADSMYVVGKAGTGKTTKTKEIIQHCIDNKITSVTCAYTHRAVGVLAKKVPFAADNIICTLHSYLKKRPSINPEAVKVAHIDTNAQVGLPNKVRVVIVDEFSMMGERDHVSLQTLQYCEDTGKLLTKVVYIGDENQLPPVKDEFTIKPSGKYNIRLTKIYRQASDNKLLDTLLELTDYIEGKRVAKLEPNENFIRGASIVAEYKECKTSKCLLAYTNARVQELNANVEGKTEPSIGDTLFSPTTRQVLTLANKLPEAYHILNIKGEVVDMLDKYNTLKTVASLKGVEFYTLITDEGEEQNRAVVFGHANYLDKNSELSKKAVKTNKDIERKFNEKPSWWSKTNWKHPMAKARSEAWKDYLAFKSNVICIDFNHAMTVHKSQGSTYENVFIDMEDIGKCADRDYQLYLKLLYVAMSRASNKVYTN